MEKLFALFNKYHPFKNDEKELIAQSFQYLNLNQNDYFLKAGDVSNKIGFVETGVFRVFHIQENGDEITRNFIFENRFVVEMESFGTGKPTNDSIIAETDAIIWVIKKTDYEKLKKEIPQLEIVANRIIEATLLNNMLNRSNLIHLTAKDKYLYFLEKYPSLVNRISLKNIASFLGIAQPSLSRIRKEISM
jgi:CRP/FNR family transcriptional regulator, anaerobic regulatory protein